MKLANPITAGAEKSCAFRSPEGAKVNSPGQRPGDRILPQGRALKGRNSIVVAPLQGAEIFRTCLPRALPWAFDFRPVGAPNHAAFHGYFRVLTRGLNLGLVLLSAALALRADDKPKPAAEPHAANHGAPAAQSGLKQELIAGLTEKDFLKLGDKPKTVKVLIVATWSGDNYGMNFNGYSKGAARYMIPKDWTVEVTFINPGPVPHSLIVIDKDDVRKLQMPEPYFKGAAVPRHLQGMSFDQAAFAFTASEAGEFAFACGFPAHSANGHWICLDVSAAAKVPTLKCGELPAIEAKK